MASPLDSIKAFLFTLLLVALIMAVGCGRERPASAGSVLATPTALAKAVLPTQVPTATPTPMPEPSGTSVTTDTPSPVEISGEESPTTSPTIVEEIDERSEGVPVLPLTPTVVEEVPENASVASTETPEVPTPLPSPTVLVATATPTSTPTVLPVATPTPMPRPAFHSVKQGQNADQIAVLYGTTVQALLNMNGLIDSKGVFTGQNLRIPAMPSPASPAGTVHTVKPGETLFAVSRIYGQSVDAIAAANGLQGNAMGDLWPGQRLIIPGVFR